MNRNPFPFPAGQPDLSRRRFVQGVALAAPVLALGFPRRSDGWRLPAFAGHRRELG